MGEPEVRRLDVTMDDALRVRLGERFGCLQNAIDRERERERPAGDDRPEVAALEEVHHDVRQPVRRLARVEDADDVLGSELHRDLRLADEALVDLSLLRQVRMEELDRDLAPELDVLRRHDGAHAAFADHALDAEASGDQLAWLREPRSSRAAVGQR